MLKHNTISKINIVCEYFKEELILLSRRKESQLNRWSKFTTRGINKDDLTIEQINFYITMIPVLLYDLHDKMQNLGVKGDAAKMQRKNQYNKAYQEQESGTVAQKTSVAQEACKDEQMIEDIFSRVYKKCENKIDIATMLHGSLKKILQWRVSELEVTRTNIFSNGMLGGL
jgi:hypothetical protein